VSNQICSDCHKYEESTNFGKAQGRALWVTPVGFRSNPRSILDTWEKENVWINRESSLYVNAAVATPIIESAHPSKPSSACLNQGWETVNKRSNTFVSTMARRPTAAAVSFDGRRQISMDGPTSGQSDQKWSKIEIAVRMAETKTEMILESRETRRADVGVSQIFQSTRHLAYRRGEHAPSTCGHHL
jgi:hypothetical protein